jgi:hypothetical protein
VGARAISTPTCATSARSCDRRSLAHVDARVYYVLPNFAAFDVKSQVVHAQAVPVSYLGV